MSAIRHESGAVSIFVVIFSALLITIVTISFIRIMINDQQQATANDLSQSAYDSAQAGVEDAKRALLRYVSVCQNDGQAACDALAGSLSTDTCNAAVRIGDVVGADSVGATSGAGVGEIRVQQSSSSTDDALDQAYTCVTIDLETADYLGSLSQNESALIPLRGASAYDTVTVEWYSREDLGDATTSTAVSLLGAGTAPKPLRQQSSWPANRPPVLRAQLMQTGSSFSLTDFDFASNGEANSLAVFMYPTSDAAANTSTSFIARDTRKNSPTAQTPQDAAADTPLPVRCQASLTSGGYSCKLSLTIPNPIGGGNGSEFLRLTPYYAATHFRVTLSSGVTPVNFNGVQSEIDSTGRANELFRRVVTRVDLTDTNFPYPDAALDLTGNLCKDFAVTDTTYIAGASCTP